MRISKRAFCLLAVVMFGCEEPPTIEQICERISSCGTTDTEVLEECLDEGNLVYESAYDNGCESELEDYLDCLDNEECAWWTECDEERKELAVCVGGIPAD